MRWNMICSNLAFAMNCLMLFLAVFGAKMEVPALLEVFGRMHPLILHFPIVLMVLAAVWESGIQTPVSAKTGDFFLLSSSLSAAFAALMGLFLSKEGGYEADSLFWHQWSGIAVSLIAFAWYAYRENIRKLKSLNRLAMGLALMALLVAGHKGAALTHGENYLFAPIESNAKPATVSIENARVFEDLVRPILKEKCMSCHNVAKLKGELNLETEETLLKGGKNGSLWDLSAPHLGLLLQRVHLPLEEKEHMPPKGKPQLTAEETLILYHWIKNGSNFKQKVVDLPENDTLRQLATLRLQSNEEPPYPFAAADASEVQKLNNHFRVVYPLSLNSPALGVDFYGVSAFKSADLKALEPVKTQVVSLNLAKMPLNDEDLKTIAIFSNLRKLNLGFTPISGAALTELNSLKSLISISLSGTSVKISDLAILKDWPQLRELFLWNTGVSSAECASIQSQFPGLRIESGFKGDGIVAKLNAPIIEGDEQVFSAFTKVHLKNYIRGATLRYTLDGSVPDSLTSPICNDDSIVIDKSCQLSTRAFLPGWISSDVSTKSYYKTGFLPDSVVLVYPPNVQYKGEGPKTLANQKIGDTDFRTNKWLGYKETNLEAFLLFNQPRSVSSVSFSTMVDIGSYIMPAAEVQVWGGNNQKELVLLKKLIPQQPEKLGAPAYRLGFNCGFETRKVSVLKIVVKPVKKLPTWHPGKGEMGWVFLDELFLE